MKLLFFNALCFAGFAGVNAICLGKNKDKCGAADECRWAGIACIKETRADMTHIFDNAGDWMPTLKEDIAGYDAQLGSECLATSSLGIEFNAGNVNLKPDDFFKNLPNGTADECAAKGCSSCTLNFGLSMKNIAGITGSAQVCGYLPSKYVSCDSYQFLLESGLKAGSHLLRDFTATMEAFNFDFDFPTTCEPWKCTSTNGALVDIGIKYSLPLKTGFVCDNIETFSGKVQDLLADKFGFAASLLPMVVNGCTDTAGTSDRHLLAAKSVTITLPGGQSKSAAQCASELSASMGANSLGADVDGQIDFGNSDAIQMEFVESDVKAAETAVIEKDAAASLSALYTTFSGIFALALLSRT